MVDTNYDSQSNIIYIAVKISSSISIILSLFIIFSFLCIKHYNNFFYELVNYLTLSTIFFNIQYLVPQSLVDVTPFCQIQAFIGIFASLSVSVWIFLISNITYQMTTDIEEISVIARNRTNLLIYGYLLPFFFSLIPFIQNSYEFGDFFCGIKKEKAVFEIIFVSIYYVVQIMLLILTLAINRRTKAFLKKEFEQIEYDNYRSKINKLLVFPIILVLLLFPSIILSVAKQFRDDSNFWLELISVMIETSGGTVLSLLYIFTTKVVKTMVNYLCCKKQDDYEATGSFSEISDDMM